MARDIQQIETVFSPEETEEFMADSIGKKANLHHLSRNLWETLYKVLWKQVHFTSFQGVENLNKSMANSVREEALENLYQPTIMIPWLDAHTQFAGKKTKKRGIDAVDDDEEDEAEKGATQSALPTRKEAIAGAAKNEVDVFLGTSFTKTGDAAQDRALRSLKTNPAQWEKRKITKKLK